MCHPRASISSGILAALLIAGTALSMTAGRALAAPADLAPDAPVDGALVPERWRTGALLGDDRSGDVRPAAAAILDAARRATTTGEVLTLADAGVTAALEPPASIKVWRRGLDGSTTSCGGRVDTIPLEKYVKGVLPHEWIRSWQPASLQAGAIAIRTYAAYWVGAGGKYDCADLDDTTASQVYKDEFFAVSDAAVDATKDVFAIKNGALVLAEYSAENSDPTAFGVAEPLCTGRALMGHGRGTCQWGSQRWAQDGKPADWIITHYYPGATLTQVGPALAATLGAQDHALTMVEGEEAVVFVEYTNAGRTAWTPATVMVGTTGPRDRASPFVKAGNWLDPTRPTGVDHATDPAAVGRFTWAMVAPEVDAETTFTERFGLVTTDGTWFGPADDAVTWTITVLPREAAGGGADGGCAAGGGRAGLGMLLGLGLVGLAFGVGRRRAPLAGLALLLLIAGGAPLAGCAPGAEPARRSVIAVGGDSELAAVFRQVGAEAGVPPAILAAVAYAETRLAMIVPADDGHGHGPPAWGLFALTDGGVRDLARAAALAGVTVDQAQTDPLATTRAAAALLADLAADRGDRPTTLAGWRPAIEAFAGGGAVGRGFADQVLEAIARGVAGQDDLGRRLVISARPEALEGDGGLGSVSLALGYPQAIWNPAYSGNFAAGNRGAAQINYVVIHTTQGSYGGTINWFKNPSAMVSSHYVVRSSDGQVTQMVDDSDVAWHDACFNSETIGIEHEGFVDDPGRWYTEAMYMQSAKLTAWVADQYGIAKDHAHIMGHGEAPDCSDHTDPGAGWNWTHYLDLVRTGGAPMLAASFATADYPRDMTSGEEAVAWLEFKNDSSITWGLDATRLGTTEPMDRESPFFVDGNWLAPNRPTGADHSNYDPGATGRFTFAIKAPVVERTTTFHEAFQLVQEGVSWFGPVVALDITVHPVGGDPMEPDAGEPGTGGTSGGCAVGGASGGGAGAGACAILLAGVLLGRRTRAKRGSGGTRSAAVAS